VQYVKKPNIASALPDNILNAIDKLDKTVAGTRLAYEILCEYLHPNVGDLWGATLEADSSVDAHGDARKWAAARLAPKKYGDHISHDTRFPLDCEQGRNFGLALRAVVRMCSARSRARTCPARSSCPADLRC
jgi:hypothetical protein